MKTQFDILRKVREIITKIVGTLTLGQMHKIPDGFNNNIVWNVAHLVVTQQLLHYRLTGKECLVSEEEDHGHEDKIGQREFEELKAELQYQMEEE